MFKDFKTVTIDPDIRSGQPVLSGSRFPVYLIVSALAAGYSSEQIANLYNLSMKKIEAFLTELTSFIYEEGDKAE